MQVTKTGDWKNTIYKALKIIKGIYSVYVKGEKYTGTCGILLDQKFSLFVTKDANIRTFARMFTVKQN